VVPRRGVPVAWVLLGVAVLLSPLFDLEVSQWLADVSPFAHQKAAGLAWFRRRDLAAG